MQSVQAIRTCSLRLSSPLLETMPPTLAASSPAAPSRRPACVPNCWPHRTVERSIWCGGGCWWLAAGSALLRCRAIIADLDLNRVTAPPLQVLQLVDVLCGRLAADGVGTAAGLVVPQYAAVVEALASLGQALKEHGPSFEGRSADLNEAVLTVTAELAAKAVPTADTIGKPSSESGVNGGGKRVNPSTVPAWVHAKCAKLMHRLCDYFFLRV